MTIPAATAQATADESLLTVAEVQAHLRINRSTVQRLLAARAFPGAYRLSGAPKSAWRIPRSSLRAYERARVEAAGTTGPIPIDDGRARRTP